MQQHKITSEWFPADESANRLEVAATDQEGLVALRDSYDPERQVFCTTSQITKLVQATEQGRLRSILGSSMR